VSASDSRESKSLEAASRLPSAPRMTGLDDHLLQQITGGGGFPPGVGRIVLKTVRELFGNQIPHGIWTVWGHKGHGEMPAGGFKAPPYGDGNGIHYTFSGRPGPDALVVADPIGKVIGGVVR